MVVAVLCALANLVLWTGVVAVQQFESNTGKIPPRRAWDTPSPFPHFQDFYVSTWGDIVALSLIDACAGYVFLYERVVPSSTTTLVALIAAGALALLSHFRFRNTRHRPDAGYPQPGKLSLHGRVHIAYLALQTFISALLVVTAVQGLLTFTTLLIGIGSGLLYAAAFSFDISHGHFDYLG